MILLGLPDVISYRNSPGPFIPKGWCFHHFRHRLVVRLRLYRTALFIVFFIVQPTIFLPLAGFFPLACFSVPSTSSKFFSESTNDTRDEKRFTVLVFLFFSFCTLFPTRVLVFVFPLSDR